MRAKPPGPPYNTAESVPALYFTGSAWIKSTAPAQIISDHPAPHTRRPDGKERRTLRELALCLRQARVVRLQERVDLVHHVVVFVPVLGLILARVFVVPRVVDRERRPLHQRRRGRRGLEHARHRRQLSRSIHVGRAERRRRGRRECCWGGRGTGRRGLRLYRGIGWAAREAGPRRGMAHRRCEERLARLGLLERCVLADGGAREDLRVGEMSNATSHGACERTWCFPTARPISSVNLLKILRLSSVAMFCQRPPSRPAFALGISISGTGSSRNVPEKSVSKNDSRISSARTTMRKLAAARRMVRILTAEEECSARLTWRGSYMAGWTQCAGAQHRGHHPPAEGGVRHRTRTHLT